MNSLFRQQTAPKFFACKTMPRFNQNHFAQQNADDPMKGIPTAPLINPRFEMRPHVNATQHRKIPPPPPQRQIFRTDPEGMQQSSDFQENKSLPLALAQQTNPPRIPPKPFINFGHQQHLLNQTTRPQFVFAKAHNIQNVNANLSNFVNSHQLATRAQITHFPTIHHHANSNQMFPKAKQQLVHKQSPPRTTMSGALSVYVESRAEKSDPENHIYEMIDESEASGTVFQVPNHHPAIADETKANSNLFQNLLRTEMMSQIQSCSRIGSNGYLSHLTQEKRMDIIQETALSLASAAYLEK